MKKQMTLVAMVLGAALLAASCAARGDGSGLYGAGDIDTFWPGDGTYFYREPISIDAGLAWESSWPDSTATTFEPLACLTYLTSSEMLLASDESETTQPSNRRFARGFATRAC